VHRAVIEIKDSHAFLSRAGCRRVGVGGLRIREHGRKDDSEGKRQAKHSFHTFLRRSHSHQLPAASSRFSNARHVSLGNETPAQTERLRAKKGVDDLVLIEPIGPTVAKLWVNCRTAHLRHVPAMQAQLWNRL